MQILRNIGIKISKMKEKIIKEVSGEREKYSKQNYLVEISLKS